MKLQRTLALDKSILLSILFLMGLGLVQVYSSSFIFAIEVHEDGLYFFRKQLVSAAIGFVLMLSVALMPSKLIKPFSLCLWIAAVVGVALTFFPGLAIKAGGAHRWLRLPLGQRFEPAELLKVAYPLFLAMIVIWQPKTAAPKLFAIGSLIVPLFLLYYQPDFGTLTMCFLVGFAIAFVFGLKLRYVFATIVAAVPAFYFLVIQKPYRLARIQAYLDPWVDPAQKGFQVIQSLLTFHSGGMFGAGLGEGQGKLFFLPEAHTDFTLAVLGEELGFVGFAFLMMIYGLVIFRGFQISLKTEDMWERGAILGLIVMFFFGVFINTGVVTGLLPTKGLALPFLSYGGSSLICNCIAFGIILNLERHHRVSA